MEIYTNSSWQKLCTSQWDEADLNLTCMAMGYYNNGVYANDTWYAERGNASKKSDYHNCTTPTTCQKSLAKKHQFCKVPVRLNGANMEYGGRVEVFYKGKWTKICRNGWDLDDVKVICRQLGFEEALAKFIGSDLKDEGIPFAMSNVSCNGDEPELASCTRIDGKVNIPPQCLSDGKGSQALCQPKNKKLLKKEEIYFDIGSSETLQCSVNNETSYARWAIAGEKLKNKTENSTSQRIRIKETGELFIDKVQLSDAGLYECYRLEYVRYYIVYINVPPKVNISGASSLIVEGNSVNLTCEIVVGRPEPEITWLKNNTLQKKGWSLLFPKIKKSDSGQYTCRAKNEAGNDTKDVNLSVKVPPRIKLEFKNVNIELHSAFRTKCYWSGDPEVHVNWTKDGVLLSTSNTMVIRRAIFKDKGYYECTAQNDYGKANTSFWIDVTATAGEEGRKCLMREIELGKLIGENNQPNIVKFMGCVTTQRGIPYDGWSEGRVVAEVTKGYQLPKPDHVDKKLHDMMKRCWNFNPDFRPPFENLRQRMDKYIHEETYEELLNLGAYDKKKYSRVEDLGVEDAGPSEEVAKKAAAKRLGKWSSDRR
ncbi:Hemicentin-2 [Stylophora pistillata]|uniref:Hemicentin-2 n=1 Tax=Stylophora pistillata TaxID=50429 RepID=A0A2B4R766_STYPI|nr:Hemicentin-2 [Stylophora pistillata]